MASVTRLEGGRGRSTIRGRLQESRVTSPGVVAVSQPNLSESASAYRDVDRLFHSVVAAANFGISPISLLQAWQDWALHLAFSPGKQHELAAKAVEKFTRYATFLGSCAASRGIGSPSILPLPQDHRYQHPGWSDLPFSAWQQSFLLTQQWWHNATTGMPA
jgi:polyhydroxyalkanoate synthase subunit PhaC